MTRPAIARPKRWRRRVAHSVPVLALAALETGTAILSVSALSFLGFGAQPPTPEWGAMVSDGQNYLATSWWLTAMPGLAIAAVTLSVNRLARAIAYRRPR